MEKKEIILSRIAEIVSRDGFTKKERNSEFKSILRCIGLGEYFNRYERCLTPFLYNRQWVNPNPTFDLYLGLDSILSDLYSNSKNDYIIALLKELTKSFNVIKIRNDMLLDFEELSNLYALLGLDVKLEQKKISVSVYTGNDRQRVEELFSVENWLQENHKEVYAAYVSAIDSYTQGHAGTCIESCRTCLVSLFSIYKGTEAFAKWMRGVFNISGDNLIYTTDELSQALNTELRKEDLADFFMENSNGKLTKTKTIYMIYSMMSDYGTHRNESIQEYPTMGDALFSLRLMDSILYWVYSKINN